MNLRWSRWLSVVALFLVLGTARRASACGGLYCDRQPTVPDAFGALPPLQAGEQIVYGVESDGSLVMSVRILYNGAAPDFAWILPVPAVPEISLGTDALFSALDQATTPTFTVTGSQSEGTCAPDPECVYDAPSYSGIGCASPSSAAAYDSSSIMLSDASAPAGDAGGLHVEEMSTVGPYDTVVLSGGTGDEVIAWLMSNGYAITTESAPLLNEYASHGSHFVALRLHGEASVNQIQPVTLTMPSTAPCLPIRLTALATQPDLPITAFFLGDGRAVSTNYSMIDPAFDDGGLYTYYDAQVGTSHRATTSYAAYVSRQARAAGGHAFVTDFAGVTPSVTGLALDSVLDLSTPTSPSALLAALQARGYLADPQILAILVRFVVPPSTMTARAYYNCLAARFTSCPAPMSYDQAGLITAIDEAITQPRAAAAALVARHPYLSRLFTTMSAPDMTLDPEFRLDPALTDASATHGVTLVHSCTPSVYASEAGGYLVTEDGTHVGAFAALPHVSADLWCQSHRGYYYRAASRGCGCGAQGIHRPPTLLALSGLAIVAGLLRRKWGR